MKKPSTRVSLARGKTLLRVFAFLVCSLLYGVAQAQISVTATGGTTSATYTQFNGPTGLMYAINTGIHTGDIVATITGNVSEGATTTALLASGTSSTSGFCSYSSFRIGTTGVYNINSPVALPTSGTTYSLLRFSSSDNVYIDGDAPGVGTDKDLTFNYLNTTTGVVSFPYMSIQFHGTGTTAGSDGCTNVSITNCNFATFANVGTATWNFTPIMIGGTATVLTTGTAGHSNIFINNNNLTYVQNGIQVMGGAAAGTTTVQNLVITNNTIASNSASGGLNNGINLNGLSGASATNTNSVIIANNTISASGGGGANSTANVSYGITMSNCLGVNVTGNKIGPVWNTSTTGAISAGINLATTCTNSYIQGNKITRVTYISAATTGPSTNATAAYGIYMPAVSTGLRIIGNNINLSTTLTGQTASLNAFNHIGIRLNTATPTAADLMIRNNIINVTAKNSNTTTGSTNSRSVGMMFGSTSALVTNATTYNFVISNNYIGLASPPAPAMQSINGTGFVPVANYTTNYLLNSGGTATTNYNLFFQAQNTSALNTSTSNGTNNSFADDIGFNASTDLSFTDITTKTAINNTGFNMSLTSALNISSTGAQHSSTPDMGADEYDNSTLVNDVSAPSITDPALAAVSAVGTRTATVTMSEIGYGFPAGANQPRLYFRKTSQSGAASWKYAVPTGIVSPLSFTIDHSLIGGVTGGDVVEYFIVAQDLASSPNVTSTATLGGTLSSVALTSTNLGSVSGTYTYNINTTAMTVGTAGVLAVPGAVVIYGTNNNPFFRVNLPVSGNTGSQTVTSLTINGAAGNSASNMGNIKLYYTGSSSSFSTSTLVGSTTLSGGVLAANNVTMSGLSRSLAVGDNYFWITLDVPSNATLAGTTNLTLNGAAFAVSNGSATNTFPAGSTTGTSKTITAPDLNFVVTRTTGTSFNKIWGTANQLAYSGSYNNSIDDGYTPLATVPNTFNFYYQGARINSFRQTSNGSAYLSYASTTSTVTSYVPTVALMLAPFNYDAQLSASAANYQNNLCYGFINDPVDETKKVLVLEFLNITIYGYTVPNSNFQIKLYERDNHIEYVYGNMAPFAGVVNNTKTFYVGLTGASQTSSYPAGQSLVQQFDNTDNFRNLGVGSTSPPECFTTLSFNIPASGIAPFVTTLAIVNSNISPATATALTVGNSSFVDKCTRFRTTAAGGAASGPTVEDDGAWFSFTNSTTQDVKVDVVPNAAFIPLIQVMLQSNTGAVITGGSLTGSSGLLTSMTLTALPAGSYYIRVVGSGAGTPGGSGIFSMSVYSNTNIVRPSNNEIAGATALVTGDDPMLSTSFDATFTTGTPATANSLNTTGNDVWYTFTGLSTATLSVTRLPSMSHNVEIWNGIPVGTSTTNRLSSAEYVSPTSTSGVGTYGTGFTTSGDGLTYTSSTLNASNTYYVRVYNSSNVNPAVGTSQFYINVAGTPPANVTFTAGPSQGASGLNYGGTQTFTWSAISPSVGGTISYLVAFGTQNNPPASAYVEQSGTSFTTTTLSPNTVYRIFVITKDNLQGKSAYPASGTFGTTVTFSTRVQDTDAPVVSIVNPVADLFTFSDITASGLANITDAIAGVDVTTGVAPRIYYKKSTQANSVQSTGTANGWKAVETSNTISPFSFTFNVAAIGGITSGDVIQYAVVAQDMAQVVNVGKQSNVAISPAPTSVVLADGSTISGSGIRTITILPDNIAPSISFTPLASTALTSTITLGSVSISDPQPGFGLNVTSGVGPRCYYKKSSAANEFANWRFVQATETTAPFSFALNTALLPGGRVAQGDGVDYFVLAQDNPGNIAFQGASGVAGFAAAPSSVALTSAAFPVTNFASYSVTTTPQAVGGLTFTAGTRSAVAPGTSGVLAMTAAIAMTGSTTPLTLNTYRVGSGSGSNVGIVDAVNLYASSSNTFSVGTSTLIGTTTFSGSNATFSSIGYTMPNDSTFLYVTYDFSSSATYGDFVNCTVAAGGLRLTGYNSPAASGTSSNITVATVYDFESGMGTGINAWTTTGSVNTGGTFATGAMPSAIASTYTGSSPSRVLGSNFPSTYTVAFNTLVYSPIFYVANGTANVSFQHYAGTESSYDYVYFDYTTDGGATWSSTANNGSPGTLASPNFQVYSGSSSWVTQTATVVGAADMTIRFRFWMTADAFGSNQTGYYIDDFAINAGAFNDVTAPAITISPIANTASTISQTFTATITDAVPSSGIIKTGTNAPRVFFKKFNDASNSTNWKSVASTSTSSPYSFNINYSLFSTPVVPGDIIQYFVAAQDGLSNGISNLGTSATFSSPAASVSAVGSSISSLDTSTTNKYSILLVNKFVNNVTVANQTATLMNRSSTNNALLRIAIQVDGTLSTLPLNSISASLGAGSTSASVTNVKLYRTSTTTFSAANQLGSTATLSSGTATFSGLNYDLPSGLTYIWVTYDITSTATYGSYINAFIPANGVNIAGTTYNGSASTTSDNFSVYNVFSFESGLGTGTAAWTPSNSVSGAWAVGTMPTSTPAGVTTTYTVYAPNGIRAGGTGTQVLGTGFGTTYPSNATCDVLSPIFYNASGSYSATFYYWQDLDPYYAGVWLDYSTNNGVSWTTANPTYAFQNAATNYGYKGYSTFLNAKNGSSGWQTEASVNLTLPAATPVRFRLALRSQFYSHSGFYVDDFSINAPLLNDVTAPTISFTSLADVSSRVNRAITGITITDPNPGYGVNTTTALPRIYYKKSTQGNSSSNWKSTVATNAVSPFTFTMDYSLIGGVSTNDVINYFFVAQDNATPNVGSSATLATAATSTTLGGSQLTGVTGFSSFTITPGPLSIDGILGTNTISVVNPGTTNNAALRVEVQVGGSTGSFNLTSMVVNGVAANTLANITNVKLWKTGSTATFTGATQVGSSTTFSADGASGTATFSGITVPMSAGSNYLWVTFDIPSTATLGNTVNARVLANQMTFNDGSANSTYPAANINPSGTTTITISAASLAYNVSRTTGTDFVQIDAADKLNFTGFTSFSSRDDAVSEAVDLTAVGFTGFRYQGVAITRFSANTNGLMQIGTSTLAPSTAYTNNSTSSGYIMPLWDDLYVGNPAGPSTSISYSVTGNAGNKVLTVEWLGMEQYTFGGPNMNWQVKLYQATNAIEFVYGNMTVFDGSSVINANSPTVGGGTEKVFSYTLGITGFSNGTGPVSGQALIQQNDNTDNFRATASDALALVPACYSTITFTPAASPVTNNTTANAVTNISPSTATVLTLSNGQVNDNCSIYTTVSAGAASTPTTQDDGSYFSFYNDGNQDVYVKLNAGPFFKPTIELINASNLNAVVSTATMTTSGTSMLLTTTNLPLGNYYVRVYHTGSGSVGGGGIKGIFSVIVYKTAVAPGNDEATGAYTLAMTGVPMAGTTQNATIGTTPPVAAAGDNTATAANDDVWYTISPTSALWSVTINRVAPFNPVMELWSALPSGTSTANRLTFVDLNASTSGTISSSGTYAAGTYYLRIYHRLTSSPVSGSSAFTLVGTMTAPGAPTIGTVSGFTGTPAVAAAAIASGNSNVSYNQNITYNWGAIVGGGSITYDYYLGTSSTPSVTGNTSALTYTSNLASGTQYYFAVRTVSSTNGTSNWSSVHTVTTLTQPGVPVCPALSSPAASVTAITRSPSFVWAAGANAVSYRLEIATDANFSSIVYSVQQVGLTHTCTTTLAASTVHYWRVIPRNLALIEPGAACGARTFTTIVANDVANNAVVLTAGTTCSTTSGNSTLATQTSTNESTFTTNYVNLPGANDDDVWFSVVPASTSISIRVDGGTTAGTLNNPVIEAFRYLGTPQNGGYNNNAYLGSSNTGSGASEVLTLNNVTAGNAIYVRVFSAGTSGSGKGTFTICATNPLTVTGSTTLSSGSYGLIDVQSGAVVTISGALTASATIVRNGGTLVTTGNNVLTTSSFTLMTGGTLNVGHLSGISATGTSGAVQFSSGTYASDANYVYSGTGSQITGAGLPLMVRNLTVSNGSTSGTLTLTAASGVTGVLNVTSGTFNSSGVSFTIASSAAGDARVASLGDLSTKNIIGTNINVQRYFTYNPSRPTGQYFYLGASVTGKTASVWNNNNGNTLNFANDANPSVFYYNQRATWLNPNTPLVTNASGITPASDTSSASPGRGLYVFVRYPVFNNGGIMTSTGSLAKGPVTAALSYCTTGCMNGTSLQPLNLVANPYASAIDFATVYTENSSVIRDGFRVWSTVLNQFVTVNQGVSDVPIGSGGVSPILPTGQGFLVQARANGVMTFNEGQKTSAAGTFARQDNLPLLYVALRNNATSDVNYTVVAFREHATRSTDEDGDGVKMMSDVLNVATSPNTGRVLAVNSMPMPAVDAETLNVFVQTTLSGVHTLDFTSSLNIPTDVTVYLLDRVNGTTSLVNSSTVYSFNATGHDENRFALIYSLGSVTGINKAVSTGLNIFPNPAANGNVTLQLLGAESDNVKVMVQDALGRLVLSQEFGIVAKQVNSLNMNMNLPAGVYNVVCNDGVKSFSSKLVIK